jgi:hypothetical protein
MIKEILDGLSKILGPIATLSKDRRELKDSAFRAISNALDETFLYYRDINNGGQRNLEREALLSKYWSAAAIPMRHFDEQLSNICEHKSEYWVNPDNYDDNDIEQLGIRLDDVRQAYRKMLSLKFSIAGKNTYTKAEKQQAHKNAYERWTTEEDEKLELLFCEGKSVKELSVIFARNEGSINARIKKLELREKYDR